MEKKGTERMEMLRKWKIEGEQKERQNECAQKACNRQAQTESEEVFLTFWHQSQNSSNVITPSPFASMCCEKKPNEYQTKGLHK
jgi:hypothetical protein